MFESATKGPVPIGFGLSNVFWAAFGWMPCHCDFWMMGMNRDFPGAKERSKKTVTFQGEVTIAPQRLRLPNFESHCTMRLMYGSKAQRWKMSLML